MKEQVRGAAVAGDVPELVEDKKVGSRVATEASLGRGDRFLLHEIRECRGQRAEADGEASLKRVQAEILSEGRLADTCGG